MHHSSCLPFFSPYLPSCGWLSSSLLHLSPSFSSNLFLVSPIFHSRTPLFVLIPFVLLWALGPDLQLETLVGTNSFSKFWTGLSLYLYHTLLSSSTSLQLPSMCPCHFILSIPSQTLLSLLCLPVVWNSHCQGDSRGIYNTRTCSLYPSTHMSAVLPVLLLSLSTPPWFARYCGSLQSLYPSFVSWTVGT